jgi:ribosomal-protein-alanine N-acetyltransferase
MRFKIRTATPADIVAIRAIERESPTAAHWADHFYDKVFSSPLPRRIALVAAADLDGNPDHTDVIGFLVAREISREWEIENVVTAPQHLRKGVADALLRDFFRAVRQEDANCVFLEVRPSNYPARSLYMKWNFKEAGKRRGYYHDPPEDAIVYRLDLHQLA